MRRYMHDYGHEFHSARDHRPLTRQEAARIVCEPIEKRASGRHSPIVTVAVAVAILAAWALAFLVAFQTW